MPNIPIEKFERLTVISTYLKGYVRYAICTCDCGNKTEKRYGDLKAGNTLSCGCINVNKLRLDSIDVNACLRGKCPPLVTVSENKHSAIRHAIWRYVNGGDKLTYIADSIGAIYQTLMYWLKKLNVYEKDDKDRKSRRKLFKRTPYFKIRCKELYDKGYPTYTAIAKELGCEASIVSYVAKENGWSTNLPMRKFKWVVPRTLPKNTIENYDKYKRTIYYFTKKMVAQYFSDSDKAKLRTGDFDIDHILSVHEGFTRGKQPLPWQLLCHPANLMVLSRIDNQLKSFHSGHNPQELKAKIKAFEEVNGPVKLPIHIK